MQIIGNDIYHEGWKVGRIDPEPNAPATVVESFIARRSYHPAYYYDRTEKKQLPPSKKRGRR